MPYVGNIYSGVTNLTKFNGQYTGCCAGQYDKQDDIYSSTLLNLNKFSTSLTKLGYLNEAEYKKTLAFLFLLNYLKYANYFTHIDRSGDESTDQEQELQIKELKLREATIKNINKMLDCIKNNSCVLQKLPDVWSAPDNTSNTIINGGFLNEEFVQGWNTIDPEFTFNYRISVAFNPSALEGDVARSGYVEITPGDINENGVFEAGDNTFINIADMPAGTYFKMHYINNDWKYIFQNYTDASHNHVDYVDLVSGTRQYTVHIKERARVKVNSVFNGNIINLGSYKITQDRTTDITDLVNIDDEWIYTEPRTNYEVLWNNEILPINTEEESESEGSEDSPISLPYEILEWRIDNIDGDQLETPFEDGNGNTITNLAQFNLDDEHTLLAVLQLPKLQYLIQAININGVHPNTSIGSFRFYYNNSPLSTVLDLLDIGYTIGEIRPPFNIQVQWRPPIGSDITWNRYDIESWLDTSRDPAEEYSGFNHVTTAFKAMDEHDFEILDSDGSVVGYSIPEQAFKWSVRIKEYGCVEFDDQNNFGVSLKYGLEESSDYEEYEDYNEPIVLPLRDPNIIYWAILGSETYPKVRQVKIEGSHSDLPGDNVTNLINNNHGLIANRGRHVIIPTICTLDDNAEITLNLMCHGTGVGLRGDEVLGIRVFVVPNLISLDLNLEENVPQLDIEMTNFNQVDVRNQFVYNRAADLLEESLLIEFASTYYRRGGLPNFINAEIKAYADRDHTQEYELITADNEVYSFTEREPIMGNRNYRLPGSYEKHSYIFIRNPKAVENIYFVYNRLH